MLLKNFSYGLVSLFLISKSNADNKYFKGTQGQAVGIANGIQVSRTSYDLVTNSGYTGTDYNLPNSTVYFSAAYGTGDTPPTIDDYQLSGEFIETLIKTNDVINVNANGITFSHSITNTGQTPITIKEIALCLNNSTQYIKACVMLTRDVLVEPIVLNPNEQRNISIFIDSNSFVQEVA